MQATRTRTLLLLLGLLSVVVLADEPKSPAFSCHQVIDQPTEKQCSFVQQYCKREAVGYINYLDAYYCSSTTFKQALLLIGSGVWLFCLFMTIGIAASDFLCPNLNTMANILGLSESLVGVTFLAFGNGSPDVFSTYAAMKIGAGSLAMGELLGAASFIAAVVTGSMAIVRPFKVSKRSFIRDVGFFLIAVTFAMIFVSDGSLQPWECVVMLLLYVAYVCFVVWWHWYNSRVRQRYLSETRAREWYSEPGHEQHIEPDEDVVDSNPLLFETPNLEALQEQQREEQSEETYNELTRFMRVHKRAGSSSGGSDDSSNKQHHINNHHQKNNSAIRPSLFSALEFRSLIQNLQNSKSTQGLSPIQLTEQIPESPLSPQPEHTSDLESQQHTHQHPTTSLPRLEIPQLIVTEYGSQEVYDALGITSPAPVDTPPRSGTPSHRSSFDSATQFTRTDSSEHLPIPGKRWLRFCNPFIALSPKHFYTLFPTMENIMQKPWLGVLTSIITAPSILLLTLTVPVYETEVSSSGKSIGDGDSDRGGVLPDYEEKSQIPRWLLFVQATLAPLTLGLFTYTTQFHWVLLLLFAAGTSAVLYVLLMYLIPSADSSPRTSIRLVSFLGFVIAISWVSTIANEVVGLLKLLGTVFKISDAILGLTVFAMGNSLGDFVANATVAKMGYPMMALSACFGGPMLNILVGVGVSCLVVLVQQGATMGVYHIDLSSTLIISGATLLLTLIFLIIAVPLNKWHMSRWIGASLIIFWTVATSINVIIELV